MSGVRRYKRNRARIVITIDVQVADAYLQELPSWRRSAMDVLRDLAAHGYSHAQLIDVLHRRPRKWQVVGEKVEVAS